MGLLTGIDVCAGSGIGSACFEALGLSRTACYIERDAYCQRLLQARMRDGWINDAPLWDDITTFDGYEWRGRADFIFGGIPCQPWSVAGLQRGSADERDLWPHMRRIIREVGPRIALVENVPGIAARPDGLGRILGELSEDGYDAEWHTIGADDVGAPHIRKRLWIVAYPNGFQLEEPGHRESGATLHASSLPDPSCREDVERERRDLAGTQSRWKGPYAAAITRSEDAAYPNIEGLEERESERRDDGAQQQAFVGADWWVAEPDVGRVVDGLAYRVDRLRTIGNGWVPQVAAVIARRITDIVAQ